MKLGKVVTVLSIAVVLGGLVVPALAQKGNDGKFQDPYDQAALEGDEPDFVRAQDYVTEANALVREEVT